MSGLISSAVGGKKAAPKAPARRRPPPPPNKAAPPSAAAASTDAPPSPPATQSTTHPTDADASTQEPQPPAQDTDPPPIQPTEPQAQPAPPEHPPPEQPSPPPTDLAPSQHPPSPPPTQSTALVEQSTPDPLVPILEPSQSSQVEPSKPIAPPQAIEPPSQPSHQTPTQPVIESDSPPPNASEHHEGARHDAPVSEPQQSAIEDIVTTLNVNNTQNAGTSEETAQTSKRKRAAPAKAKAPVKRTKKNTAASSAQVQEGVSLADEPAAESAQVNAQGEQQASSQQAGSEAKASGAPKQPAKRKPRQKSAATIVNSDDEGQHGESGDPPATKRKQGPKSKRGRPKKTKEPPAQAQAESIQPEAPDDDAGRNEGPPGGEEGGEGGEEEEEPDPELHEIDPDKVTMYQLGRDAHHGKTSERGRKMAEIDWAEVAQKQREAVEKRNETNRDAANGEGGEKNDPPDGVHASTEGADGSAERPQQNAEADGPPQGDDEGPRFRVVNGQIVADEDSMMIDRDARAQAEADAGEPVEEETDLTRRINRTTWVNERRRDPADRVPLWKSKSDPWTEEDTERFYDALKSFGTDFFIISKMFPPRTRKQIKHKFVREERLDPRRINAALLGLDVGTKPAMDLNTYAQTVGQDVADFEKYRDVQHADEVIKESCREKEEELTSLLRTQQEDERQRVAHEEMHGKGRKGKKEGQRVGRKKKSKGGGFGGGGMWGGGPQDE